MATQRPSLSRYERVISAEAGGVQFLDHPSVSLTRHPSDPGVRPAGVPAWRNWVTYFASLALTLGGVGLVVRARGRV
jgi:hypothetical protein